MVISEKEIKHLANISRKTGREVGMAICNGYKEIRIGTRNSVDLPACPILIHTHFHSPLPSTTDIVNAKQAGVKKVCVIHVPTEKMYCHNLE